VATQLQLNISYHIYLPTQQSSAEKPSLHYCTQNNNNNSDGDDDNNFNRDNINSNRRSRVSMNFTSNINRASKLTVCVDVTFFRLLQCIKQYLIEIAYDMI
jgi:hypothetical protein